MERKIINKESFSEGKKDKKNDDDIFIGENFAAVIDGVSHKSTVLVNGKPIKIAEIIVEAIQKLDGQETPEYAKTLTFEETVKFINLYIKKYLQKYGLAEEVGKMEATGIIYSKYHNQLWLVGDCRAIYDGNVLENPLKIDGVYIDIRRNLIEALMQEGYTKEDIMEHDISRDIIKNPELLENYIKSPELRKQAEEYRAQRIKSALLECGLSEQEIEEQDLIKKYYDPRNLQKVLKNNPNMQSFGYAVFNGEYTETKNCKVATLPDNVKTIKMFSDGFQIGALDNEKDIGYAIRKRKKAAELDPLSIAQNPSTHVAVQYSQKEGRVPKSSIDDASAIVIEIQRVREDYEREE